MARKDAARFDIASPLIAGRGVVETFMKSPDVLQARGDALALSAELRLLTRGAALAQNSTVRSVHGAGYAVPPRAALLPIAGTRPEEPAQSSSTSLVYRRLGPHWLVARGHWSIGRGRRRVSCSGWRRFGVVGYPQWSVLARVRWTPVITKYVRSVLSRVGSRHIFRADYRTRRSRAFGCAKRGGHRAAWGNNRRRWRAA